MTTTFEPRPALLAGRLTVGEGVLLDVEDPATGEIFAQVPDLGPDADTAAATVSTAVAAALAAQPAWAADEQARIAALGEIARIIAEHADELGELVSRETGKSLFGGGMEAVKAAEHVTWAAEADLSRELLVDEPGRTVHLEHLPHGVVAAIVPWNAPLIMAVHKTATALRCGNTVVLKPSPVTPVATLRFVELIADVLPAGVLSVLSGGDALGPALTGHRDVAMISFTGSVPTGRAIMAGAAPTLKRLVLELGGNDAAIVLEDADPALVAPLLFRSAFINSGQVCQAIKRLYVHRSVYDAVVDGLVACAEAARLGGPLEEGSTFGPLTTAAQLAIVEELVSDASARGGVVRTGGRPADRPGHFYPPTIVTGLDDDAPLVATEQFGPALPVLVFDDVEEAVTRANGLELGLSASVWGSDLDRASQVATRLQAGSVWINRHAGVEAEIPFGGLKQSGIGRESGREGLLSFTETRTIERPRA
jgi:acyl-CoA reductase-like NAD-dependent aldehyde dehydrogenase